MGINREAAAFLCDARADGVSFGRVLTLGRLNFSVDRRELEALARRHQGPASSIDDALHAYSERFFKSFLGAETVEAVDHSDYEGAALTHDMNRRVPGEWEQRYDTVVDGGTLEHIFNFPEAIANCMRLLREGGRLFIFTPANNQLGHGFYQFSPELFYRALAPAHGFEIESVLAVQFRYASTECGALNEPYRVADPASVRSRVTLVNSRPVSLMIRARKTAHLSEPFETFPQQSDYGEVWATGDGDSTPAPHALSSSALRSRARLVKRLLPAKVGERLRNEYDRHFVHSFRNKAFYTRVKD